MSQMDFEKIRRILPQQFPMILVDRVLEVEKGHRLTAVKNVSGNDIVFQGHFPNLALMPGVLLLESLGQATILLYHLTYGSLAPDDMPLFGSVNAKFRRPVFPGDQLRLEVEAVKMTSFGGVFMGVGSVDGQEVVSAELCMGRKARTELQEGREREEEVLI